MQKHIWIVDDEQAICWAVKKATEVAGYRTTTFSNAEDALRMLTSSTPLDVVILDMRMPGMDGFAATAAFKKRRPHVPIIIMTAFGDLSSAIQAIELDVFEYLTKPFDLTDGLKAIAKAVAAQNNVAAASQTNQQLHFDSLLGSSPAMQSVYKQIAIAAKSQVPVLIHGPSGTGKGSIASAIHRHSLRSQAPFLVFSPISVPPIALAMEFLGSFLGQTGKGAQAMPIEPNPYTTLYRSGALELAGNGVLYIDEVADLTMSLQSQLLSVLERKYYVPLGDSEPRRCETRIMMSTNRNLLTLVEEGEFLEELRQQLSVFTIEVKPLSERRSDIVPLATAILKSRSNAKGIRFSSEAEEWLVLQPWLGNLRELQIAIDHAMVVAKGIQIETDDLIVQSQSSASLGLDETSILTAEIRRWTLDHLEKLERQGQCVAVANEDVFGAMYEEFLESVEPALLKTMMTAFQNNRAAIAAQLGMHRSTLRQKMRRYKIE